MTGTYLHTLDRFLRLGFCERCAGLAAYVQVNKSWHDVEPCCSQCLPVLAGLKWQVPGLRSWRFRSTSSPTETKEI